MVPPKSLDWGENNEKAYDSLIVAVEASDEVLTLLLAVCDEPQLQDDIIQRYEAELQPRIRPYQVLLSRREPSLREAIAEVVEDNPYLRSGGRAVITIRGAELLLSPRLGEERSEKEVFFGYLQWTREGLLQYPYPIILWLTNPLVKELSRKAPDFWSWRKDVFHFVPRDTQVDNQGYQTPNNLPYSGTPQLVGRQTELFLLHEQLQGNEIKKFLAISGMGGVGKTELALQYGLKHLSDGTYPGGICWVQGRQDIVGMQIVAFARIFWELKPPEDWDLIRKVKWCWRHWYKGEVLVIFDDVINSGDIQPFLPPADPRFKVLLTTRRILGLVNLLFLDVLKEKEALQLLRLMVGEERINKELEEARKLCDWLGYLPLALELIGRYLARKPNLSVAELLRRLQEERLGTKALKRLEVGMTAELTVAAAFELSWKTLDLRTRILALALSLFALAPIPLHLIKAALPDWDEEDLEEGLDEKLVRLSLLYSESQTGTYSFHTLVREFVREKLATELEEQREKLRQSVAQGLIGVAKTVPETVTVEVVEGVQEALPHLAEAATHLTDWIENDIDRIRLFTALGRIAQYQSRWEDAESWYQACVTFAQQRFGTNHLYTTVGLNNLAALYQSMGRYTEAEPLYNRALAITEKELGANHPNTANSLNNLAELYRAMGRYTEAEPLYNRALAITKKELGANHPSTATSLNNLALLYQSMGRYTEAEPLLKRALAITEKELGANHPSTATSLNNLVQLYTSQGRLLEEEPLKQTLNLRSAPDLKFFSEWREGLGTLSEAEQHYLDRVKTNFLDLLEDPAFGENSVKMIVLAPLLDLAGFYRRPWGIKTEASMEINLEDEGVVIRGKIDVLVVSDFLWLVVIESKRSDFAVTRAIPQTLAYMLGNPEGDRSTFGLITNGSEFLFLKTSRTPTPQYATSRLFSLVNPTNELYEVLAILKRLALVKPNVG